MQSPTPRSGVTQSARLELPRISSLYPQFGTAAPEFGRGQLGGTLRALEVRVFEVR